MSDDFTPDSFLVEKYLSQYVRKGFRRIFEEQRRIAASRIYGHQAFRADGTRRSRSGTLQRALESPKLVLHGSGSSLQAEANYPEYIRFLDMKRLGNYRIYNRPIWGILYKETFRDIKYEFSSWLRNFTHGALTQACK